MKEKIQKMWKEIVRVLTQKLTQFLDWKYRKQLAIACVLVILVSAALGYYAGNHFAVEKARIAEEKLTSKYQKEKNALEQELKEAQIKNPEVRPWYLTLVNDTHPMEEGYVPKLAALDSQESVDERILEPLKQMIRDAEKEGLDLYVCSSYRSVERQQQLYNLYIGNAVREGKTYWKALEETKTFAAYPGRSEHGMGLAVDIVSNHYTELNEKQQETPEAKWLAANCYKYGFILRYPVNKTDITGIIYEPWHYRYVGVEDATKITEMGITLEEYLGEVD